MLLTRHLGRFARFLLAPGAGFEPATHCLTGSCSTIELPRIIKIPTDSIPILFQIIFEFFAVF